MGEELTESDIKLHQQVWGGGKGRWRGKDGGCECRMVGLNH